MRTCLIYTLGSTVWARDMPASAVCAKQHHTKNLHQHSALNEASQWSWLREPLLHTTPGNRQYHSCAIADQRSLTEWWFGLSGAGKQSHIPEEGKKPEREGVALLGLRLRFPAGPSKHPRAPLWPGHQAGYLAAIIWQGYDVLLWSFKANLQLIHKH